MALRKVALVGGLSAALLVGAFVLGARYAEGRAAVAQRDAIAQALKEQREHMEEIHRLAMDGLQREQVIVERVRYVEREIPRVQTPDCQRLGADWLRLFNAAILDQ